MKHEIHTRHVAKRDLWGPPKTEILATCEIHTSRCILCVFNINGILRSQFTKTGIEL